MSEERYSHANFWYVHKRCSELKSWAYHYKEKL